MKTTSKNLALIASVAALILTMATPAMAIDGTGNVDNTTTKQAAACLRIASLKPKSDSETSAKVEALQNNFKNRLAKMQSNFASIDQKIAQNRKLKTTQFTAKIAKIKATPNLTDEQIKAIDTFVNSVQQAEAKRETAVDTARLNFRTALAEAVSKHQQEMLTAAITFHQDLLTAFDNAKANCANEGSLANLKTSIKSARETMVNTRNSEKLGQTIKQLAQTRTDAIKTANNEFKASINEYAKTLADALGATSQSDQTNQ